MNIPTETIIRNLEHWSGTSLEYLPLMINIERVANIPTFYNYINYDKDIKTLNDLYQKSVSRYYSNKTHTQVLRNYVEKRRDEIAIERANLEMGIATLDYLFSQLIIRN